MLIVYSAHSLSSRFVTATFSSRDICNGPDSRIRLCSTRSSTRGS